MKHLFAALFSLTLPLLAIASQNTGPHGGAILRDDSHEFELTVNPSGNSISVYTLRAENGPPKKMAVTLFRESGSGRKIELAAVKPAEPGLPKFQGELSPNAGSFVGVELRFETSLKSLKVLKLVPYIPPRPDYNQ